MKSRLNCDEIFDGAEASNIILLKSDPFPFKSLRRYCVLCCNIYLKALRLF